MKPIIYIATLLFILSCSDEREKLAPAEDRISMAIDDLKAELTAPPNGWRVEYQPTSQSGIFFMLLDFGNDNRVTIKSDVAANNGEFVEQTIPYRIDAALNLELIFETYGVFHYLFELQQSRFGAEFEFLFVEKEGENLIFSSKSDITDVTFLRMQPANADDNRLFSLEEMVNLSQYEGITPQIFGGAPPIQQLFLIDKNISLFWSIDLTRRNIDVDFVATGKTLTEINMNNDLRTINHQTGYTLLNGKIILLKPLTFTHSGEDITIAEIKLANFSLTGNPLCTLTNVNSPVYEGEIPGVGSVTIFKSLVDSNGFGFLPMADRPYSVNVLFIFDENANSLFQGGIIEEKFPNATGFVFNYGLNSGREPSNAVGFFIEDANGQIQTYLREFEATVTEGNKINISLTSNFYYSATPHPNDEQSLTEITDLLFSGGEIYTYDLPQNGITVFRLFNPCNLYEAFLVQ